MLFSLFLPGERELTDLERDRSLFCTYLIPFLGFLIFVCDHEGQAIAFDHFSAELWSFFKSRPLQLLFCAGHCLEPCAYIILLRSSQQSYKVQIMTNFQRRLVRPPLAYSPSLQLSESGFRPRSLWLHGLGCFHHTWVSL